MGILRTENSKLGIIIGSNRVAVDELFNLEAREIETRFGQTFMWFDSGANIVCLQRHGKDNNIPPHMINHRANMNGFKKLQVENIISFTSVGSLNSNLEPGTSLMPDDYINFSQIPTNFDTEIKHIVPSLDTELREKIYSELKDLGLNMRFNGIYIQTRGPRLETRAEIQMLKSFGDVVGMTMASEATLAKELELKYANISVVDNYCNGIIDEPLTHTKIKENQKKNCDSIRKIIHQLLKND
jgi:5'-methylthioadenosine phosphorylase